MFPQGAFFCCYSELCSFDSVILSKAKNLEKNTEKYI